LQDVDHLFAGAGAEYLFPTQIIPGSETYLELDAFLHTTASSNITVFPLTLNQRFYGGPGSSLFGREGRSFFFLGGGVTWIDPRGSAKLTFHGGFGSDIGPRMFTEAALFLSDGESSGLRNTGVSLSIGYRF
ncbi:MAG TPA: hypothetical protein VMI31_12465, partial [Fimbriimonadaceae bacterium]|nr:hypothetical protein [Fimbriimonadaceae bacterium]